jgi:DNA-binding MarR family transcriptional regulator
MTTAAAARRTRADLLQALDHVLRQVGAQSVLISDTIAGRVALNSTDLECLDLLFLAGPTTAGRLAEHTGLTTGAMTAVLDRLERARCVRRRRDSSDRRRVLVEVLPRALERLGPFYAPLAAAMSRLHDRYGERELAVIVDYLSRAVEVSAEHVKWLSAQPPIRRPRPRRGE